MVAPNLSGQTAIVTGAGRGIGRAIAQALAASGAHVVLAARTADQLAQAQREIESAGGRATAACTDVTDPAQVDRLVQKALQISGTIDVLVNNAGAAPLALIHEMSIEEFDAVLATNVRAVFLCTRAVWKPMMQQRRGVVLNISSRAADDPFPGFAAYGAAKSFVNAYTRALAAEGQPVGIRVYGIAPGAVDTPMLRGAFPDYPPEKMLRPADVAALALLLLSPAGQYSSGQTIRIQKP